MPRNVSASQTSSSVSKDTTIESYNSSDQRVSLVIDALTKKNATDLKKLEERSRKNFENLEKEVKREIGEIRSQSFKTIESIGFFAALLAFVAFEAQIFSGPLSLSALIGISLIMLGSLSFFAVILNLFFGLTTSSWWRCVIFVFAISCLIAGVHIAAKDSSINNYITDSELDTYKKENGALISETKQDLEEIKSNNELLDFKNCVLRKGLYSCL